MQASRAAPAPRRAANGEPQDVERRFFRRAGIGHRRVDAGVFFGQQGANAVEIDFGQGDQAGANPLDTEAAQPLRGKDEVGAAGGKFFNRQGGGLVEIFGRKRQQTARPFTDDDGPSGAQFRNRAPRGQRAGSRKGWEKT